MTSIYVSKPRDSVLNLCNRSEIWQAPRQYRYGDGCQIEDWYNNYHTHSPGFARFGGKTSYRLVNRGPGVHAVSDPKSLHFGNYTLPDESCCRCHCTMCAHKSCNNATIQHITIISAITEHSPWNIHGLCFVKHIIEVHFNTYTPYGYISGCNVNDIFVNHKQLLYETTVTFSPM